MEDKIIIKNVDESDNIELDTRLLRIILRIMYFISNETEYKTMEEQTIAEFDFCNSGYFFIKDKNGEIITEGFLQDVNVEDLKKIFGIRNLKVGSEQDYISFNLKSAHTDFHYFVARIYKGLESPWFKAIYDFESKYVSSIFDDEDMPSDEEHLRYIAAKLRQQEYLKLLKKMAGTYYVEFEHFFAAEEYYFSGKKW